MKRILVMGISGAGKTTFVEEFKTINREFVHLNNDRVRKVITAGIGFSTASRIRQAEVMGDLVSIIGESGFIAISDFICPLQRCRAIFKPTHLFWINRISDRYPETTAIFEEPTQLECKSLGCKLYTVTEESWRDSLLELGGILSEAS